MNKYESKDKQRERVARIERAAKKAGVELKSDIDGQELARAFELGERLIIFKPQGKGTMSIKSYGPLKKVAGYPDGRVWEAEVIGTDQKVLRLIMHARELKS